MKVSATDLDFLSGFLKKNSGMIITPEKAYLVEARLGKLARDEGHDSLTPLLSKLRRRDTQLEQQVIEAMTVNETSFFRDNVPFDALVEIAFPEMIEARRAEKHLRIWCAASSTGQEPYTVAILLREKFPELDSWRIDFWATDLSTDVLDKARGGEYSQLEVNRGVPTMMLVKHFERTPTGWRVNEKIRKMVDFRRQNLLEDFAMTFRDLDLLLMRNVLIYFDVETKRSILGRARSRMAPHGYLLLGGAETTMNVDDEFERIKGAKCSMYRLKNGRRSAA
ncbi:MAG: protein-glutamate O-methyltransferase CheR [Polyangiaceae bacterium]